jgi:hypothetical protein
VAFTIDFAIGPISTAVFLISPSGPKKNQPAIKIKAAKPVSDEMFENLKNATSLQSWIPIFIVSLLAALTFYAYFARKTTLFDQIKILL